MIVTSHSLHPAKRPIFKTAPLWLAGLGAKEKSQHSGRGRYVQRLGNLCPISKDYRRNGFWEKRKEAFKWRAGWEGFMPASRCGVWQKVKYGPVCISRNSGGPVAWREDTQRKNPPLSEPWVVQMLIEQAEITFPGTGEEKSVPGHQVIRSYSKLLMPCLPGLPWGLTHRTLSINTVALTSNSTFMPTLI